MEIGDRVIYYTQDGDNAIDRFAIVLAVIDDHTVDVVYTLPGGNRWTWERVSQFNKDDPGVAGQSFWRAKGEAAPDFSVYQYSNDPQWGALYNRHTAERVGVNAEDLVTLKAKQKAERDELYGKLGGKDTAPAKQAQIAAASRHDTIASNAGRGPVNDPQPQSHPNDDHGGRRV